MARSYQWDAVTQLVTMAGILSDFAKTELTTDAFLALLTRLGGRVRHRHEDIIVGDVDGCIDLSAYLLADGVDRIEATIMKIDTLNVIESGGEWSLAESIVDSSKPRLTETLGPPRFDGTYGDIGYPREEIGDRVVSWNLGEVELRVVLSHEDSEAPIFLAILLQKQGTG